MATRASIRPTPDRIGNPFGDRSVIDLLRLRPPDWLGTTTGRRARPLEPRRRPARRRRCRPGCGRPAGLGRRRPAPLLVANDGTGLGDRRPSLLSWATWHGRGSDRSGCCCSTRPTAGATTGTPPTTTTPTTSPTLVLPAVRQRWRPRPRSASASAWVPSRRSPCTAGTRCVRRRGAAVRQLLHPADRPAGIRLQPVRPGLRRPSGGSSSSRRNESCPPSSPVARSRRTCQQSRAGRSASSAGLSGGLADLSRRAHHDRLARLLVAVLDRLLDLL